MNNSLLFYARPSCLLHFVFMTYVNDNKILYSVNVCIEYITAMGPKVHTVKPRVRRQSQYLSFNLEFLDNEDEIICRKYTQVNFIL